MSTTSQSDLRSLAARCTELSDEIADADGFVSVRSLTSRFQAELILRPLLVEGMLASRSTPSKGVSQHQWAVLIDSETYPEVDEKVIAREGCSAPLPARMRNTIAHELAHSFAF